ncbi:MAG: SpoIID/LytB domain-containing protein [Syntrophales bacterium]
MFRSPKGELLSGGFTAIARGRKVVLAGEDGRDILEDGEIRLAGQAGSAFTLFGVTIGGGFHWARDEGQTFRGDLVLVPNENGTVTAINVIPLEDYICSVVSSEMSGEAPLEFLKAHAVVSRSWLAAMLDARDRPRERIVHSGGVKTREENIRWYGREDHNRFDVCADDHCQRYHGIERKMNERAADAVAGTRGLFLVYRGRICDTRFSKACGGITENFENAWEDVHVPYLSSIPDAPVRHRPIRTEKDAGRWLLSEPPAYCNAPDIEFLTRVLPSIDLETKDFFRWRIEYEREDLEIILREKSGIDFGTLESLVPIERGPSGRIVRLMISGSKKTAIVGKELEIRRWLSKSHLYSSAFVVSVVHGSDGKPARFILHGGGWGHGVGLCQIGAACMAERGFTAQEILRHYFKGARLKKLY